MASVISGCDVATQQQLFAQLNPEYDDRNADAEFGNAVALQGGTAFVAAWKHDENEVVDVGAVYIYGQDGINWLPKQKLLAESSSGVSDVAPGLMFGAAIATDGDTLAVGSAAAHVYIYTRSGDEWVFQQRISGTGDFGRALDISGDTLVVGNKLFDSSTYALGTVYVYERHDDQWDLQQTLSPTEVGVFGFAVAISGDIIAVGDPRRRAGTTSPSYGIVHIYRRTDDNWLYRYGVEAGYIESGEFVSDVEVGAYFGYSVDLEGDYLTAGAPGKDVQEHSNAGAVYTYRIFSGEYSQARGKLTADFFSDGDAQTEMQFGYSVSMSGDNYGVGLPNWQNNCDEIGAGYAFSRFDDTAEGSFEWLQRITAQRRSGDKDEQCGARFGYDTGLSGDLGIVGAPSYDSSDVPNHGTAYVFMLAPDYIFADVDENGFVTPADAVGVFNRLGEPVSETNVGADVDEDGDIDDDDVDDVIEALGSS